MQDHLLRGKATSTTPAPRDRNQYHPSGVSHPQSLGGSNQDLRERGVSRASSRDRQPLNAPTRVSGRGRRR